MNFAISTLAHDGFGNGLTTMQVNEISGLAALGFELYDQVAIDVDAQLAAIQQAIWPIQYPTANLLQWVFCQRPGRL